MPAATIPPLSSKQSLPPELAPLIFPAHLGVDMRYVLPLVAPMVPMITRRAAYAVLLGFVLSPLLLFLLLIPLVQSLSDLLVLEVVLLLLL